MLNELPELIESVFPVTDKRALAGHSMGGHGALTLAMKNPERFCSVSAFSPIVNPVNVPWGEKAFTAYLGANRERWKAYDSCELIRQAKVHLPMLVDQGTEDSFLEEQLKPELLVQAAEQSGYPLQLRMQEGYDHSYYFIASFIEEHLVFHSRYLKA